MAKLVVIFLTKFREFSQNKKVLFPPFFGTAFFTLFLDLIVMNFHKKACFVSFSQTVSLRHDHAHNFLEMGIFMYFSSMIDNLPNLMELLYSI